MTPNTALAAARGRLIARMDADDVCTPPRLARQRGHLADRPELGLVASRVRFGGDALRGGGYAQGTFPEDHELWPRWLEAGVRMEKHKGDYVARNWRGTTLTIRP